MAHTLCKTGNLNRLLNTLLLFTVSWANGSESSGGKVAVTGQQAAPIVLLPTGDSVEIHASGPAVVPEKPPGLVVTYHPFFSIDDTVRTRTVALALFRTIEPRLDPKPPFVVLKAVDRSAAERSGPGFYSMHSFGVVLDHGPDGRWYPLGESTPILER